MMNNLKTRMEISSGRRPINISHTQYIIYTEKHMIGADPKYHKAIYIEISTVYTITDQNIDLPHWKYICCFCQKFPPLPLTDEETSPSSFVSFIKYHVYKDIKRCSIYSLHPLGENKKCPE